MMRPVGASHSRRPHRRASRRLVTVILRPVALSNLAARVPRLQGVPLPRDDGYGMVPGPDPLKVAVIGDATAVGFGTVSQQLGVAGHFARLLGRRDRRGVEWNTAQFPEFTMRRAMEVVSDGALLRGTEKVVVIVGIRDAVGLMPLGAWSRLVDEMLATLRAQLPPTARVTVAEIPPLELYSSMPPFLRRWIAIHARDLNAETRAVVARHERVSTIAFPAEQAIDLLSLGEARVSELYLGWAQSLLAADVPEESRSGGVE
ncbi:SGNH/GDSL hydrolase family protein [Microbacteriaceae bacterium 4G12]